MFYCLLLIAFKVYLFPLLIACLFIAPSICELHFTQINLILYSSVTLYDRPIQFEARGLKAAL